MNIPDNLLGEAWYWVAWFIWLPLFARAVWWSPWRRLGDSEQMNVWLGMIVLLVLIWSLKAGVRPGLSLHLLGATVFSLCFGPQLAFVGLSLVTFGVFLNEGAGFFAYALNALLMAGGGVLVSHGLFRMLSGRLPKHFFIYIFIHGFLGAALSILSIGLIVTGVLGLAEAYAWDYLLAEYLPYFLLLAFAEAWLSGMVMTLFVVYRPGWVASFDDSSYLLGK